MIHPEDWEVFLRLPRPATLAWALPIILLPALVITLPVMAFGYLGRGRFEIPSRDIKRLFILIIATMTAIVLWAGISTRAWQAACWRLGPDGVPPQDRAACDHMPRQGVEGYY